MGKPEKLGRLAKWAIQLGELNIDYQAPTAKKAQVLADFLDSYPTRVEEAGPNSKMDDSLTLIARIAEQRLNDMTVQEDALPPPPEGEATKDTPVIIENLKTKE